MACDHFFHILRFLHFENNDTLRTMKTQTTTDIGKYVGHLESKERLHIQPAQLFNFS